ncbi:hypothetical protein ACFY05_40430 [Microtetraspora fusca]|uniref:Uncharacterized protein n=1 Tax=Microtetraspora fusca TaxID=1997 RepID=A0ABW6VKH0_MICFU
MRRIAFVGMAVACAVGLSTAPAAADRSGAWKPAPSAPWDVPAGARCAFPVHGEPAVDEVRSRVLKTFKDGTVRTQVTGAFVLRLTNKETGATTEADAGGDAVIDDAPDGSKRWRWKGPVMVGFSTGMGNHAPGLFILDGIYRLEISATGYRELTKIRGTEIDLCAALS